MWQERRRSNDLSLREAAVVEALSIRILVPQGTSRSYFGGYMVNYNCKGGGIKWEN